MRKYIQGAFYVILIFIVLAAGCATAVDSKKKTIINEVNEEPADRLITVGFSQLGAESDWRSDNTDSMLGTFTTDAGY